MTDMTERPCPPSNSHSFAGTVGRTIAESTPAWPAPIRPPAGAPNVVVIVLDDVGFAQLGCFGARIRTPHMDSLADSGLRYTNFHATSLCSTTRACLLTGRNHHSVGMGFLADFDTGYPNARGSVSPSAGTLAEMLGARGYGTHALGKWHLAGPAQMSPSGPFHQWPTGRGFDRWYGFLWGEDDQWAPELWYDQHRVDPPAGDGYHLSEDLVDRAKEFIGDHVTADPSRPFFTYLAFGACHAPHQAPREFIERYRGVFDEGWDVERVRVLDEQIRLGVVPPETRLAPRNPGVPAWDSLTPQERKLCARMQETFAGFMEHTDAQIGRLLDFLRQQALLDDTVVMLLSDNGASGEGGRHGSLNEYRYFLGLPDDFQDNIDAMDELGGPWTHNHYPAGWAQAGNTPFKYYKSYTFAGGIRTPLIVKPAAGSRVQPGVRDQFHHVIDLAPTILDLAGVSAPETYRGIAQQPLHGVSMRYTFHDADAPTTRDRQYFETAGQRGLWRDGWKIITHHQPGEPFEHDQWELYQVDEDRSETQDRAGEYPELVEDMVAAWWREAERYDVLPLDDRKRERAEAVDPAASVRTRYEFLPGTRALNRVLGPDFAGRSFTITADVHRPDKDADGVLLAHGRRAAGFSLFVVDNQLWFDYNLAGRHVVLTSDFPVPTGDTRLAVRLDRNGLGAEATLYIDDTASANCHLDRTLPGGFGCLSTQAGHNSPSPVSDRYQSPFRFAGTLRKVVVDLDNDQQDTAEEVWQAALAQD
ncbi:arylsulfatase [Saccharopolyspora phatthalungensis]|uniref:Arylsulfatase n=1 Tax=Saccharopolyspora phatthalungensis TaxID=664693 RepID=A0A840QEQ3_9PSEU|nr:arylsulfatase [Saccharopolyspora phatthalungensis]MBB5158906.1 arylsulfatase [Saccharopolyspora phatthalungensis]